MSGSKAPKPEYNFINPETLSNQVNDVIKEYCNIYGIDLYNYNFRVNIKHNEVNNILRYCYNKIFKPDKPLYNNQRSLLNYDSVDQLTTVTEVFLNVCSFFNKALGLFSFSIFTGITSQTLMNWLSPEGEKLNPTRFSLLKSIREYNQGALIDNLKDSPVGALAVANNDIETGLNWSKNNVAQITNNTVYLLPNERNNRLQLGVGSSQALDQKSCQE